mmetsp:Transcript_74636/g.155632  ORF Transcript_74636/g.155632 Transcript_74636/m.155632 type:complete len:136 (-) Transcript_74636:330-737(-)
MAVETVTVLDATTATAPTAMTDQLKLNVKNSQAPVQIVNLEHMASTDDEPGHSDISTGAPPSDRATLASDSDGDELECLEASFLDLDTCAQPVDLAVLDAAAAAIEPTVELVIDLGSLVRTAGDMMAPASRAGEQ